MSSDLLREDPCVLERLEDLLLELHPRGAYDDESEEDEEPLAAGATSHRRGRSLGHLHRRVTLGDVRQALAVEPLLQALLFLLLDDRARQLDLELLARLGVLVLGGGVVAGADASL